MNKLCTQVFPKQTVFNIYFLRRKWFQVVLGPLKQFKEENIHP